MTTSSEDNSGLPKSTDVIFTENGKKARMVAAHPGDKTADLLKSLGLESQKLLLWVVGSADGLDTGLAPYISQLLGRGIIRAAQKTGAMIMDGGTHSGVMALLGEAIEDLENQLVLLGVAPCGLAKYPGGPDLNNVPKAAELDPNHTHFLLSEGRTWGAETPQMVEVGDCFQPADSPDKQTLHPTVVMVLLGGFLDGISKKEVLQAVRRGWPVIVIEGSGELADKIADCLRQPGESIQEPDLAEIVEDGELFFYPLKAPAKGLQDLIVREFDMDQLLIQAWQSFSIYDIQAARYQNLFYRIQKWILGLGVVTTLLVILSQLFKSFQSGTNPTSTSLYNILRYPVILLPIATAGLLAFYSKLNPANKWVLLRSSAEAIKRAIYVYRTRPVIYPKPSPDGQDQQDLVKEEDLEQAPREVELYSRLKFINSQLMQTDVNLAALPAYKDGYFPENAINPNDNGFRFLLPQDYIKLRLEDQLNWYRGKVAKMERELHLFQAIILTIGGVGTFLAAIALEIWVALTTSLLTALTTYLQYKQTEHTLMQYNQTAINLANILSWWLSLTPDQQVSPVMVSRLVRTTERILETESVGWVQQMKDALAELQKEEEAEKPAQKGSPSGTTVTMKPGAGNAGPAETVPDGGEPESP